MGHSVEIPYLDKKNIEIYLNDLAIEIEKANIGKHSILIVGGAALALKYEYERSTVDIDICFREQNKLKVKGIRVSDVESNFERLYGSKYYLLNDEMKLMYVNMQLG